MATTPAKRSWELAEDRCYKYLKSKLSGIEGVTAHKAELPITHSNATDMNVWMFSVTGPGSVEPILVRQTAKPACAFTMGAKLEGVFADRTTAQQLAGLVMDALPIDVGELDGVTYFYYSEMPTLVREVVPTARDNSTGGDQRVWLLTFPMVVVFSNARS